MTDDSVQGIYLALMILLPLSALWARRLPLSSVMKMALAWIAIFGVLVLIVGNWGRFANTLMPFVEKLGVTDQSVSGNTVRLRMSQDGHFWATVSVNGVKQTMLIDSGATTTALSVATAKAAGLDLEESSFPTILNTANGPVSAKRSTVAALDIGSIHAADLPVVVSPAFADMNVIGMNFLSRLRSWRVEGDFLILEPKGHATPQQ